MATRGLPEISGKTRVLLILADPVAQVRTPQAINALAAERGVDCAMVPCEVAPADLKAMLHALRAMRSVDGAVVTAPHKMAAVALCDEISPQARRVGAVNAIRRTRESRLIGDVFDGKGFVAGLASSAIPVAGQRAFMSGAGGAACAIGFALAEAGVARLVIYNRTREKAQRLAERIVAAFPGVEALAGDADPTGADLVINATSLGARPEDDAPFDLDRLDGRMTVAEIVMQPPMTALLLAAERRGCRIQVGQAMLQQQLALIADFLGVSQPPST